jgi:hypothetical protein
VAKESKAKSLDTHLLSCLTSPIPLTAPRPSQIEIAVSDDDLESYPFPKECPPKGAYTKLSPYRYRSGPRGTHSGPRGVYSSPRGAYSSPMGAYSSPRVPIQALGVPIQTLGVPIQALGVPT